MCVMTIQVTQEHIEKGVACSHTQCPIALAMKDAGIKEPMVRLYSISYVLEGRYFGTYCPKGLMRKIIKFDADGKIKPFSFHLNRNMISL